MEDASKFLTSTLAWALTVETGAQSEAGVHLVAIILNKYAASTYRYSMIASSCTDVDVI